MATPPYSVHYHCHVCGQMHPVAAPRCLPAGLTEPCTIADLYPGGNMPPAILDFLTDSLLWCDQAGDERTHRNSLVSAQGAARCASAT